MVKDDMSEREKKLFQTGLFDDLTVQDAFTIIALYAAQLDIEDCKEDLNEMLMTLLRKNDLFNEDPSHTLNRINKFTNSMKEVNPLSAIERAIIPLSPELRHESFMLAAQIAKATLEIRTTKILKHLASKISIDQDILKKAIRSIGIKG